MKYKELFETPIGSVEVHNMDEPGTFPEVDRKLLTNSKHIEKVRYRFRNVPWLFNLYFINQPGEKYTTVEPVMRRNKQIGKATFFTPDFLHDLDEFNGERTAEFIKDFFQIDVKHDSNAISVCYISNANEQYTVPLTPWMIAHRFGHSLEESYEKNGTLRALMKRLPSFGDGVPFTGVVPNLESPIEIQKLMTMRSARNGQVLIADVPAELIAQYLMAGQVTLKRVGIDDGKIARVEKGINDTIHDILNTCVGKIFVAI